MPQFWWAFASKRWPNVLLRPRRHFLVCWVGITLECNSQIQQLSQTCLVGKESCFCLARRVNMEGWKWHTTTTPKVLEAERCSCVSCTIAWEDLWQVTTWWQELKSCSNWLGCYLYIPGSARLKPSTVPIQHTRLLSGQVLSMCSHGHAF